MAGRVLKDPLADGTPLLLLRPFHRQGAPFPPGQGVPAQRPLPLSPALLPSHTGVGWGEGHSDYTSPWEDLPVLQTWGFTSTRTG